MRRPTLAWAVFLGSLAVVLAAMGWVSLTALRLDRAEEESRRQAELEETVRLALWRMDSLLAVFTAQESARRYFDYSAFYAPQRAYDRMLAEFEPGEVAVASPLLSNVSPIVQVHFQIAPDGAVSSPQVPAGAMRLRAETSYATAAQIERRAALLDALAPRLDRAALVRALPPEEREPGAPFRFLDNVAIVKKGKGAAPGSRASVEWNARAQMQKAGQELAQNEQVQAGQVIEQKPAREQAQSAPAQVRGQQAQQPGPQVVQGWNFAVSTPGTVREGPLTPLWQGETLLLARRVTVGDEDYVQGCWLNWPELKKWLLGAAADLLPSPDLVPVPGDHPVEEPSRMLVAIPARLVPGEVPRLERATVTPIRLSLGIAWLCVISAAAAIGFLLRGALSLSERRGAFVSAVTHELRTPLTTFRMYAEMLAEGMVPDPERRKQYLTTLCVEADRLSHLVENVLAYARLERGRRPGPAGPVAVRALLAAATGRLRARAEQARMELAVEGEAPALDAIVRADAGAVEQVLFNLVDNACKYASAAADRRIHITVEEGSASVAIAVRDHGPGMAATRRLFQPFSKSARDAANSAPGVGLGLALSKRLLRAMGGDLRLEGRDGGGARFAVVLPRVSLPPPGKSPEAAGKR